MNSTDSFTHFNSFFFKKKSANHKIFTTKLFRLQKKSHGPFQENALPLGWIY